MPESPAATHQRVQSGGCRVPGAGAPVAVLLRLSRVFGLAPVSFRRQRSSHIVHVSRKYAVVAYVFALIMGFLTYTAMVLEIRCEMKKKELQKYEIAQLMINCINYIMTSVVIALAARRGAAGIDRFLSHYMTIQKIYLSIENKPMSRRLEKWFSVMVAGSMTIVAAECVSNVVVSTSEQLIFQRSWIVHILQKLMYVVFFISSLLVLQITFTVTAALWTVKALNRSIIRLHGRIQCDGGSREAGSALTDVVRRLGATYAAILDVCERVNATEGCTKLVLLLDSTFRFVAFSFFATRATYTPDIKGWRYASIAAQIAHLLRISLHMVLLVDPCHRTHGELKRCRELISEALCAPPTALDGVSVALQGFYGVTEPYRYVYTPMGTFKLSSSVYTALIGGLTTLIIIIINL